MTIYKQINKLADEIHSNNKAKGFWDDEHEVLELLKENNEPQHLIDSVKKAFIGQKLALITSEISEALEADRKDLMDDKLPKRLGLEVELADGFIRILDMAGGMGLDIGGAIEEKLAYNKTRAFKHGKAY